jgi:hypothetical protein
VGLARPSLVVGVFWSFYPFDLLYLFIYLLFSLIFCNFLEMVMCQNGIGGCKMPLLHINWTYGALYDNMYLIIICMLYLILCLKY